MGRTKQLYMDEQQRLADEYMEANPGTDEQDAWEAVSDDAWHALGDHLADMADHTYQQWKDAR